MITLPSGHAPLLARYTQDMEAALLANPVLTLDSWCCLLPLSQLCTLAGLFASAAAGWEP